MLNVYVVDNHRDQLSLRHNYDVLLSKKFFRVEVDKMVEQLGNKANDM